MAQFIYLYKGPATSSDNLSAEESQAIMAKWGEWMDNLGSAMVDMGKPMNPDGVSLADNGNVNDNVAQLNGYSIVEANDLTHAQQMASDHPFLSDNDGVFSIEIYELLPVPGM